MAAAWHNRCGKGTEAWILPAVLLLCGSEAMTTACCPSSLFSAFAKQDAELGTEAPLCPGEPVSSRRFFWPVQHISANHDTGLLVTSPQEPLSDRANGTKLSDMAWDGCQPITHCWINLPFLLGREGILLSTVRSQITGGHTAGLDRVIRGA